MLQAATHAQEALRKETGNLVSALRPRTCAGAGARCNSSGSSSSRGWSSTATSRPSRAVRDPDGNLLRPDLVVRLAGGKNVVVDAKTPLDAYLDALATDDEATRAAHLARHARLVREHMTKLGQKQYWKHFHPLRRSW